MANPGDAPVDLSIGGVRQASQDDRYKVMLVVCSYATDVKDAAFLIDSLGLRENFQSSHVLGLLPSQTHVVRKSVDKGKSVDK